ncbi:MAG: hypothetical protein ABIM22_07690 [candidate division WOR-3 bacterium]
MKDSVLVLTANVFPDEVIVNDYHEPIIVEIETREVGGLISLGDIVSGYNFVLEETDIQVHFEEQNQEVVFTKSDPEFVVVRDVEDSLLIEGIVVTSTDVSSFVKKSGDVMTGPLILYDDPQYDYEAATKHYVDNSLVITRDMLVNNQNKLLAVNNDGTGISFIGIIDCGTY